MKSPFDCKLLNETFGDPGLYVSVRHERRAILFDLGDVRRLSPRQMLAITDIFISHTHLDHFIGFDELLRVCLGRDRVIHLYGPPGFISQVEHKLAAYTWNLVEGYETNFTLVTDEVHPDGRRHRARFCCQSGFVREPLDDPGRFDGVLLDEPRLRVHATFLDHRIPCLGFCLEEKVHVGVKKNRLNALGFSTGHWLRRARYALIHGAPDDTVFDAPTLDGGQRSMTLGALRQDCLTVGPGPRIGYVTDIVFNDANLAAVVALAEGAEILFIEASFTADETARAAERYHLTTAQAGAIARAAGARRVIPFHFSPRHAGHDQQMLDEVRAAFRGR